MLVGWSEKWPKKFGVKCKVLHIGNDHQFTEYTMNCSKYSKVVHEKDLAVTIIMT